MTVVGSKVSTRPKDGDHLTAYERVLWIGGRSGAGKSTVARLLARRHGLRWYSCDTRTWEHRDRAIAAGDAAAIAWEQLTPQQRSELSTSDALRLAVDRSTMVLDDIAALPEQPAVVAEGTTITPGMVPAGGMAVWLTAASDTRAERARRRGWGAAGIGVDLAMERQLRRELQQTPGVIVDTDRDDDPLEVLARVERIVANWLATRPTAAGLAERRALIREGNAAIVAQYRSGLARAGNTSGAQLSRAFDCECGDQGCTAFVDRTLGSLADPFTQQAAPILASGHPQSVGR